jgi:hypothetical protein
MVYQFAGTRLYFKAMRFALSDSSMELKCTQSKPTSFGGSGTTFNFISVIKASVPSDPAISLQKLKSSLPAVNGADSSSESIA